VKTAGDFETRSAVDLKTAGLHNYATDKTTGIHCFSWGADPCEIQTWAEGDPFPQALGDHLENGGILTAWNVMFEYQLWNECAVRRYGWPKLRLEQVECSMARAYAMSLPGALEKAALALGLEQQKDMAGARVMMQLAQPKADGTFWTRAQAPEKFERLYEYNRQDVRTELAACDRMMALSPQEQALWHLDAKINQRGIHVDLPSIEAAMRLVEIEKARLDAAMLRTTGGVVGKCTEVQLLVKWIRSQGVEVKGLAKSDVLDALSGELPAVVARALELRREAAKSSTAKLVAMKNRASSDGRVRGTLQYHGANTGRWAGRGIQVHNFPRGNLKPEAVADAIEHMRDPAYIDIMHGAPLDVVASSLRGFICAPEGHELVAVDFSAIEARVLAWLAGEEGVLEIFRTHGLIYEHAAAGIYNVPMAEVTKAQRQIGKVAVLALGYGGGIGAFQSMARNYNVKVADSEADAIKVAWREAHPSIVRYWRELENAAINAVQFGDVCKAGPVGRQVAFKMDGSFLWCRLPSGRVLCYPYPSVKDVEVPWGGTKPALYYWCVNGTTNKWEETSTYGGSLAENVTQAVARDLLAEALLRLDHSGYPVTMHVHDEAVVEIAAKRDDVTLEHIESLMTEVPKWADGLPIAAEGWRGTRYRK
jgi:DNA polymerase bacteriophage-type